MLSKLVVKIRAVQLGGYRAKIPRILLCTTASFFRKAFDNVIIPTRVTPEQWERKMGILFEQSALFFAFGLSLSLFGFTILEALPVSTESLVFHQSALAIAYWVSLWLLSIYVIIIVPSLVGSAFAVTFGEYFCCI